MTQQQQQIIKRMRARHAAECARYRAGHSKPPTRKQARGWLEPIRKALRQMMQGEIDSYRGYAITRLHHTDDDFARVDHCINGFLAMIERVMPDIDTGPLSRVSRKLTHGVLLTADEIAACFVLLNACEDRMITISRERLKEAALTEQINIELEMLGLKEAA